MHTKMCVCKESMADGLINRINRYSLKTNVHHWFRTKFLNPQVGKKINRTQISRCQILRGNKFKKKRWVGPVWNLMSVAATVFLQLIVMMMMIIVLMDIIKTRRSNVVDDDSEIAVNVRKLACPNDDISSMRKHSWSASEDVARTTSEGKSAVWKRRPNLSWWPAEMRRDDRLTCVMMFSSFRNQHLSRFCVTGAKEQGHLIFDYNC